MQFSYLIWNVIPGQMNIYRPSFRIISRNDLSLHTDPTRRWNSNFFSSLTLLYGKRVAGKISTATTMPFNLLISSNVLVICQHWFPFDETSRCRQQFCRATENISFLYYEEILHDQNLTALSLVEKKIWSQLIESFILHRLF